MQKKENHPWSEKREMIVYRTGAAAPKPSPRGEVGSKAPQRRFGRRMRGGEMLDSGRSLEQIPNRQITARIPHQSKIRDFCQLPPGGSLCACGAQWDKR